MTTHRNTAGNGLTILFFWCSVLTHVVCVAYVASAPLGLMCSRFCDVFWIQLGKDVFLADV